MQIERITNDTLESCLQAVRSYDQLSGDLLQLELLGLPATASTSAISLALTDYLRTAVSDAYVHARLSEDLPGTLPNSHAECQKQILADYSKSNSHLEAWSTLYFRYICPVPLTVEEMSTCANVVPQQLRRRLNLGLNLMVSTIQHTEMGYVNDHKPFGRSIPLPDYSKLIGIETKLAQITTLIDDEDARIISIEGMGGIGKTSLARAFLVQARQQQKWENILWVSAKQEIIDLNGRLIKKDNPSDTLDEIFQQLIDQLGMVHLLNQTQPEKRDALISALNEKPYLVVIDNLETINDLSLLIPEIAKCSGKTKFILTTRESLKNYPFISCISVSELSEKDAYLLLCSEISRRGQKNPVSEEDFRPFFSLMGGIPLVIKLGVGQLQTKSVDQVLEGFSHTNEKSENLFQYLYWQTWNLLSDNAKHLLISFLPADPDGEDANFIQEMSGLTEESFFDALSELDQFSLLEISGRASAPLYRLHRITITFLQTELLELWNSPA